MKKETQVVAVRLDNELLKMLRHESVSRKITISELIRSVIEQRQASGGREQEERLISMEIILSSLKENTERELKKIYYHAVRASFATIAEYRIQKGDKEASEIGQAIRNEIMTYKEFLKKSGKEF